MAYIALKAVKFDRSYVIGEIVPNEVISPSRINDLKKMEIIAEIPDPLPSTPEDNPAEKKRGRKPKGE